MSDKLFINVIFLKGLTNVGLLAVGALTGVNTFNAVNQQNVINNLDSTLKKRIAALEGKETTDSKLN